MKLIEYLDIESIFKHVKYNQLECYPTSEEYSSELIMQDEPTYYVEDMYKFLLNPPEGVEINIKDDVDEDLIKTIFGKKIFILEWSIGGNESNEGGDNYWGYGWEFTIDLDNELFVDFCHINYC